MSAPSTPTLRYGELLQWLGEYKVSERQVRRLIAKEVIKSYSLGGTWNYYNRAQVEREVLPLLGVEKGGTNGN